MTGQGTSQEQGFGNARDRLGPCPRWALQRFIASQGPWE